ncbi:MAG: DUF1614 domain-containing protein [Methanocalculus sp. MSAO_Arc1]|uniref:DUF1614 domain-containing protein n=1 Tax=Methanocalculus TaxID=71151 RepID=UPI000FEF69F4|nr:MULTISPECIES: DUF1614 domain-containing protein [unclassified Methanocalculus]MCP1662960.1 putative membrane protein [Methanocalculus sp. AMF5]RQD81482.1 MAG: DUF1614 domain-containing protein [Methanocalculus sp. MSAO_Arc1]
MSRYVFFNPFSILMVIILFAALIILIPFLFLGIVGGALTNLGLSWLQAIGLLILILIGSLVNVPVTTIREAAGEPVKRPEGRQFAPSLYENMYRVQPPARVTQIAVNLGGAVIPVLLSAYLLFYALFGIGDLGLAIRSVIGVLVVTIIVHRYARLIPGVGIGTPFFLPPLAALACGILLAGGFGLSAAIIAYTSGTLGTLLGADLLNLRKIGSLGAPVVSIGGAGTFDGIFLSGIIAAFLA